MKKLILVLLILFVLISCTNKKMEYKKKIYTTYFANAIEGTLDKEVDIMTKDYFIYITFANDYKKTIKKTLKYSKKTDKIPGIVFIIENGLDAKLVSPFLNEVKNTNIRVWVITSSFDIYDWIWLK